MCGCTSCMVRIEVDCFLTILRKILIAVLHCGKLTVVQGCTHVLTLSFSVFSDIVMGPIPVVLHHLFAGLHSIMNALELFPDYTSLPTGLPVQFPLQLFVLHVSIEAGQRYTLGQL